MLSLDDQVKPLDIQKLLQELVNRSLLLKTQDGRYQYQPLVQQYSQQKVTDLSVAHQKAIDYYLLHTKASPWQTLDDVTEYLEIVYYYWKLQQYTQAFDTIPIEYHQQSLKIKQEIGDRRGEADSWFNLAITLNKLNRVQDAMGAYRNARVLFQAMELNEYVQKTDNAIQKIETSLAKASHPIARNWLLTVFSFIWCRVQNFWGVVRGWFRR